MLSGSPDASNVVCTGRRCKIIGPGEIVGGFFAVTGNAQLKIIGAIVRDQLRGGLDGLISVAARRVTMTGIGFGHSNPSATEIIRTAKLDAVALDVQGNGGGVVATDYNVRRSTIVGNRGIGIGGPGKGRLVKSTVTGNSGGVPVDVFGVAAPRLIATTCDHSYDANSGAPFGICALD